MPSFPPPLKDVFDNDDDEGWQDMPIICEDTFLSGLDEEDQKKYHYQVPVTTKAKATGNATGNLIDIDDRGNEWRSKLDRDESDYTRLRVNEEDDHDEVHLRTKYLFDEDKAMTPLSQMQATKNLLTDAQRIAYVGLCALTSREMIQSLKSAKRKELKAAITNMELWALKIMGRLYYHMELETQEQKMIECLAEHGVLASDLVPPLMTTHTVANPEYDPAEARRQADARGRGPDTIDQTLVNESASQATLEPQQHIATLASPASGPSSDIPPHLPSSSIKQVPTTTKVLKDSAVASMPGVSTSLSSADESVTLDIRWTILCDLFLVLIADSVYDARSRVLLEQVALKLGLGWLDVVKFESRITEALEIQEDIETLENKGLVEVARKAGKKRRYMMLGLATLGGGLVIGLSAGLLAPVIGLGLAGALTTVGVTGTGAFLGGTAGAAVITTGGVLTGSGLAAKGMANRTQQVRTFDILPLHNNKRVNCILTVPGFMNGMSDDVRLPFSVLDPIVGDVFSILWEPEMIRETGSALSILTGEVLSQIGMTVLQATIMTGLMSALQWPIILTKLGYLIDNPWSNALDRARSAGRVLADVLVHRHLGVRPITLIGFSLGARVIFYALLELAKQKQFGIVQDVFLLGATLTVSQNMWWETRSAVSGRYVNAFARNDWVLNYLFRATSGGVGTVAGLRPIEGVPGIENVDVTDKISGHMSYRTFMPLILDQLGFPVFADFFDEPVEPEFIEERVVVREEEKQKSGWFSKKRQDTVPQKHVSRPPGAACANTRIPTMNGVNGTPEKSSSSSVPIDEDDLPPRLDSAQASPKPNTISLPSSGGDTPSSSIPDTPSQQSGAASNLPAHAGFDLKAIKDALKEVEQGRGTKARPFDSRVSTAKKSSVPPPQLITPLSPPHHRAHSVLSSQMERQRRTSLDLDSEHNNNVLTVSLPDDNRPKTSDAAAVNRSGRDPWGSHHLYDSSTSSQPGSSYLTRGAPSYLSTLPADDDGSWGSPSTAKPFTMSSFSSFSSPPNLPSSSIPHTFVNNSFSAPGHDRMPVLSSFGSAALTEFSGVNSFGSSSSGNGNAGKGKWDLPPLGQSAQLTSSSSTLNGLGPNPWS